MYITLDANDPPVCEYVIPNLAVRIRHVESSFAKVNPSSYRRSASCDGLREKQHWTSKLEAWPLSFSLISPDGGA
jgi:hypothetical protein